jgi:thiamine-phosphate pyrophosphorylase
MTAAEPAANHPRRTAAGSDNSVGTDGSVRSDGPAGSAGSAGSVGERRRARLAAARLYLCTDARIRQGDLAAFVDAVLGAGVDIIQLRDKSLEARAELDHLAVLADACRRHGALLAVNDRADIAHAVDADVLHLGQGDLPVPAARAIVGDDMIIGRSCHAESEVAAAAIQPGVDYFCTGPVWPTPTKPGRPAPGLPLVEYAAGLGTTRPWFAIGGIDHANVGRVRTAGARRVVVVRAITEAKDPAEAAARLAALVRTAPARP